MLLAKRLITRICVGFTLLIVLGCAPPPTPEPAPTAIPYPVAGSYLYTSFAGDTHRLTFGEDWTWNIVIIEGLNKGTLDAGGTYTIEGDQIALTTEEFFGLPCSEDQKLFVLQFQFDGQVLLFNTVEDPCAERATQFTAGLWQEE